MSGQQMNGFGIPQKNRKRKRTKKGPYDDYPLEVREFLQIYEGIIRRALAEDANLDNSENGPPVAPGEQEPSREQLPNLENSQKAQVTMTGRNVENTGETANSAGKSRIKRT